MRHAILVLVAGLLALPASALPPNWAALDQMVRHLAKDGWTREDYIKVQPRYRELSWDLHTHLGVEHASSHPTCVRDAQRAWVKLGRLLQSPDTDKEFLISRLDQFWVIADACPTLQ